MVCAFPSGESFKHFQLKWCKFAGLSWSSVRDPELADQAQRLGRRVLRALHDRSYTRCDLRIDARGERTVLECNMDCGIFYPPGQEGCADQILQSEPSGHREFMRRILDAALLQSRLRQSSHTTTKQSTRRALAASWTRLGPLQTRTRRRRLGMVQTHNS